MQAKFIKWQDIQIGDTIVLVYAHDGTMSHIIHVSAHLTGSRLDINYVSWRGRRTNPFDNRTILSDGTLYKYLLIHRPKTNAS